MKSLFTLVLLALSVFGGTKSAQACGSNEVESCNWVQVCTNPADLTTCTSQMSCVCIGKPSTPEPGPRCEIRTCSPCDSHQRFCGYWDNCSHSWSSGQNEGC